MQSFVWLLIHGRVQCQVNLCHKFIVDSSVCTVYNQAEETSEHIVFDCPFEQEFWQKLWFETNQTSPADLLINALCPSNFPKQHFNTLLWPFVTGTSGNRGRVVFREETTTIRQTFRLIQADAILWGDAVAKEGYIEC